MKLLVFVGYTWEDFFELEKTQQNKLYRILKEIIRSDPKKGIGNPEPLEEDYTGLWSRCLSEKDRLIYKFDDEAIYIIAIGGHYDDQS